MLADFPIKPDKPASKEDGRNAARKKATGRVKFAVNNKLAGEGKLVDISISGAAIILDVPITGVRSCLIQIDSFTKGKRFVITGPAIIVFSVLSGHHGQKLGITWGSLDPASTLALQQLFSILD